MMQHREKFAWVMVAVLTISLAIAVHEWGYWQRSNQYWMQQWKYQLEIRDVLESEINSMKSKLTGQDRTVAATVEVEAYGDLAIPTRKLGLPFNGTVSVTHLKVLYQCNKKLEPVYMKVWITGNIQADISGVTLSVQQVDLCFELSDPELIVDFLRSIRLPQLA